MPALLQLRNTWLASTEAPAASPEIRTGVTSGYSVSGIDHTCGWSSVLPVTVPVKVTVTLSTRFCTTRVLSQNPRVDDVPEPTRLTVCDSNAEPRVKSTNAGQDPAAFKFQAYP